MGGIPFERWRIPIIEALLFYFVISFSLLSVLSLSSMICVVTEDVQASLSLSLLFLLVISPLSSYTISSLVSHSDRSLPLSPLSSL